MILSLAIIASSFPQPFREIEARIELSGMIRNSLTVISADLKLEIWASGESKDG